MTDVEDAIERLRAALRKGLNAQQAANQVIEDLNERENANMAKQTEEKFLTRITVDLVTDEPLSERRQQTMARELTNNLHVLVVEDEDQPLKEVDKYIDAHTHDTAGGDRCQKCLEHSLDYRNGTAVANGDV